MTSEFALFLKEISGVGRPTIPILIASEPLEVSMESMGELCCVTIVIFRVDLKIGIKELMLKNGFYLLKIWVTTYRLMRQMLPFPKRSKVRYKYVRKIYRE